MDATLFWFTLFYSGLAIIFQLIICLIELRRKRIKIITAVFLPITAGIVVFTVGLFVVTHLFIQ